MRGSCAEELRKNETPAVSGAGWDLSPGRVKTRTPDYAHPWLTEFQERAEGIGAIEFLRTDDGRAGAAGCFPAVGCSPRPADRLPLPRRASSGRPSAATAGRAPGPPSLPPQDSRREPARNQEEECHRGGAGPDAGWRLHDATIGLLSLPAAGGTRGPFFVRQPPRSNRPNGTNRVKLRRVSSRFRELYAPRSFGLPGFRLLVSRGPWGAEQGEQEGGLPDPGLPDHASAGAHVAATVRNRCLVTD